MYIMELRLIFPTLVFFGFVLNVYSANIYIGHTPPTLQFRSADPLRLSEISNVIAGSLGYTTISTWPGLAVSSPFGYPKAFILVNILSNDHDIKLKGISYEVKQDASINDVHNFVETKLKSQSENVLSFQDLLLSEVASKMKDSWNTDTASLNQVITDDETFIHEMEVLPNIIEKIEKYSSMAQDGQDIIFLEISSLNAMIAKYGRNSSQVKEADYIVENSLMALERNVIKFYEGRVVFATVVTDDSQHRSKRQTTFTENMQDLVDINLATPYNEDFPVIFNIVLFLSIVLLLAIVASAASMALMDPGHDSIIYRMTNPRMKKD